MRLTHLTFTGADDSVDPCEMARLSREAPLIEWGILFSAELEGRPRFPSRPWRQAFYREAPGARRAAHLCGRSLLQSLAADPDSELGRELRADDLSDDDAGPRYGRFQLNFDATELPAAVVSAWIDALRAGHWRGRGGSSPVLITQHNAANARVHEAFRLAAIDHAVLFDASGGQGRSPASWPTPLPGLACGYAGGLGPHTIGQQLPLIAEAAGHERATWIDMEGGLRIDDRFDLERVREVIGSIRAMASGAEPLPGLMLP